MAFLFNLLIVIIVFILMEGVTWLSHKYLMHNLLWFLHKDHHQPGYPHVFQKNDAFFIIFAIPSILLFYFGFKNELNSMFYIGMGILFCPWKPGDSFLKMLPTSTLSAFPALSKACRVRWFQSPQWFFWP